MRVSKLYSLPACFIKIAILTILSSFICSFSYAEDEALAPPTLGEETKGTPAVAESRVLPEEENLEEGEEKTTENQSPLGYATITEQKRESGQIYLIELEHSLGGKQYLYENDSDGQIGSSVEEDESLTEIPKWKLGSW